MASRKVLFKDEAARSVGKTLGFAPLIGLAGLLFGLSLTTHRMAVVIGSAVVIVVGLAVAAIAARTSSPAGTVETSQAALPRFPLSPLLRSGSRRSRPMLRAPKPYLRT